MILCNLELIVTTKSLILADYLEERGHYAVALALRCGIFNYIIDYQSPPRFEALGSGYGRGATDSNWYGNGDGYCGSGESDGIGGGFDDCGVINVRGRGNGDGSGISVYDACGGGDGAGNGNCDRCFCRFYPLTD